MLHHLKEFLESILHLVKVQKTGGTNKCYLAQKKVVLFNYIFIRRIALREFPPLQIGIPTHVYHYKEYKDLVLRVQFIDSKYIVF